MKNNIFGETIISIILIALLSFFLNPIELLMPQSIHVIMIPLLIVFFIVLVGVLWKETPGDERDHLHKYIASRFAYFAGVVVLLLAIITQSFQKTVDPWLIITLCIILLAKLAGILYGNFKH